MAPTAKQAFLLAAALLTLLVPAPAAAQEPPAWWPQVQARAAAGGYRLVAPDRLKALLTSKNPPLLVDARADYEFRQGRLPSAVNLEFDLGDERGLSPEKTAALQKLLGPDKNRPAVFYCRNVH